MQDLSSRYLLPPFITVLASAENITKAMPFEIAEVPNKEATKIANKKIGISGADEDYKVEIWSDRSDDDCKIDKVFYRIYQICLLLGVNFNCNRSLKIRFLSMMIVGIHCCVNLYFVGYIAYLTLTKPFEADRVATSISIGCWLLQAMFSTLFVAYWQYTNQPKRVLTQLYEANNGLGIRHYRKPLVMIVNSFHIVLAFVICYYCVLIVANILEVNVGYWDRDIALMFGTRRMFIIAQLSSLYCKLCWAVAIFVFGLLIHSTYYEFAHFNEQVRSIKCNKEHQTDEALCDYLLKMMRIHNRLAECVKRLDEMFSVYAFVMIATIIPTTIFSLFMLCRSPNESLSWEMLLSTPLVVFCIFSFCALVNAPSRLHKTACYKYKCLFHLGAIFSLDPATVLMEVTPLINETKSALCANTDIWFPYRANVYHSALAFVCHLDQTNLGVSIWGFAVVSKPLVLTTLSVMVTCLALFLQVGECNVSYRH